MKNLWKIVYYETSTGECPVEEFINSKNPRNQAKLLAFISLLEERGPNLPRPYADLLEDGIHELRVKLSGNQIRVFYFFCYQDMIVLTHAFTKTTQKVPVSEIKIAQRYREDFLKRFHQERD
jgi:phage-related protein